MMRIVTPDFLWPASSWHLKEQQLAKKCSKSNSTNLPMLSAKESQTCRSPDPKAT